MRVIRLAAVVSLPVLLAFIGTVSFGQDAPPPPADQGAPSAESQPPAPPLNPDQLQNLVAPIALYPDNLLSEILAASTYPIEVVEAQQWLQQNRGLKGQKLMDEAKKQNWDPSIQALIAFPDVLTRLNQDIRWTTDLGNAFLAQQADVMHAVQDLRMKAQANGKLQSTPQESVSTETENGQSAIQIQPVEPGVIYVPVYNPAWVWGPPVYGFYPPLFYPGLDVGFSFLPGIDLGFYFGGGWGLWGGFGWGWGPDWFGGRILLNGNFFHRYGFNDFHRGLGGVWAHDPGHRWACHMGIAPWLTGSAEARVLEVPQVSGAGKDFGELKPAARKARVAEAVSQRVSRPRVTARSAASKTEVQHACRAITDSPASAVPAASVGAASVVEGSEAVAAASVVAVDSMVAAEAGDEHDHKNIRNGFDPGCRQCVCASSSNATREGGHAETTTKDF
jgi:hypothetical protein